MQRDGALYVVVVVMGWCEDEEWGVKGRRTREEEGGGGAERVRGERARRNYTRSGRCGLWGDRLADAAAWGTQWRDPTYQSLNATYTLV